MTDLYQDGQAPSQGDVYEDADSLQQSSSLDSVVSNKALRNLQTLVEGKADEITTIASAANTMNEAVNRDTAELDRAVLTQAVETNQPPEVVENMARQMQLTPTELSVIEQLARAGTFVSESLSATKASPILNNDTTKLANKSNDTGNRMALSVILEHVFSEAFAGTNVATGIAATVVPGVSTAQGLQIGSYVRSKVGELPYTQARSSDADAMRKYLASLPSETEQAKQVLSMYKELSSNLGSKFAAGLFIKDIVQPGTQLSRVVDDVLEVTGQVIDVGGVSVAATNGAIAKLRKSTSQRNMVADTGRKDMLSTDAITTLKTGDSPLNTTVVQATDDTLTTGIDKVLPKGVSTHTGMAQDELISATKQLLDNLESTVVHTGLTEDEIKAAKASLMTKYSPAINKTVASVDFNSVNDTRLVGDLYRKPEGAVNFATKEAAESWAKSNVEGAFEIVPDTANATLKVDTLKQLKADRATLEAEVLSTATKTPISVVKDTPTLTTTQAVPNVLKTSKPRYKTSTLSFDNMVDKAAYQVGSKSTASKSDPEIVNWLKQETGWDDAAIKAHAVKVRNYLKTLPEVDGSIKVRAQYTNMQLSPTDSYGIITPDGVRVSQSLSMASMYAEDAASRGIRYVGNVALTSNTPALVDEFVTKLGKAIEVQNSKLAIVDISDIKVLPKAAQDEILKRKSSADGLFFVSAEGIPTIVMNREYGNLTRVQARYMETFAHEYGHFFENAWAKHYAAPLQGLFNDYLKSKRASSISQIDYMTMLDMRSNGPAMQLTMEAPKYNRSMTNYLAKNPQMKEWLKLHQEWFAENFAKWALTDEVPTNILGQAFKALTDEIKKLIENIAIFFRGYSGVATPSVREFMNKHVQKVNAGAKQPINELVAPTEAMWNSPAVLDIERSRKLDELNAVTERIADIEKSEGDLIGGYLVRHTMTKDVDYSAVRGFDADDIEGMATIAIDPALGTSAWTYDGRVVGVHRESRLRNLLTDFIKDPVAKLNKAERNRVVSVLTEGDAVGVEFSRPELLGKHLTDKEIAAYQRIRTARNVMHKIRDGEAVASLDKRGYRVATINMLDGDSKTIAPLKGFAKQVDVTSMAGRNVYDATTKSFKVVTPKFLEANTGRIYLEFFDPIEIEDGRHVKRVVADATQTYTSKIESVIPYREGEFSRIYDDQYFVKVEHSTSIDDLMETDKYAYKTARNKRESDAYVKAFNEAVSLHKQGRLDLATASRLMEPFDESAADFLNRLETGGFGDNPKAVTNFDRTEDDYLRDYTRFAQGKNGFTRSRGERLGKVDKGERSNTIGVLDSIQAEITNTARVASITAWRDTNIIRWYNEFQDILTPEMQRMSPVEAFFATGSQEYGKYIGTDKRRLFASRVEKYIRQQLGQRTKEEQLYEGFARTFSEWVEGKTAGNKKVEWVGAKLRNSDTIGLLRTVNFHTMLGALNPVQFITQSLGMVNAIAINPKFGMIGAKNAPFLRMALMSDRPDVWADIGNLAVKTAGKTGIIGDDFVETVRAIRRTGLLDGVRSSSLYNIEDGKFNIFSKSSTLSEASGFFFNRGEEFARLATFDMAKHEFIRDNPGVAWWTDANLQKILARQDDLTQNMTKANTAFFQQGALSIPFQFLQYNLKLGANLFSAMTGSKRSFTVKEAYSILLGQLAIFGVANNGLPDFVEEMVSDQMDKAGFTREQRLYFVEGIVAGLINSGSLITSGTSTELAIGERFNTFDWYKEFTYEMVAGEKSALDLLLGPTANTAKRLAGFKEIAALWVADPDVGLDTVKDTLYLLGTTSVSTLSNLDKAIIAKNNHNYIMSKSKQPIARATDSEIFFQAVGIPPAEVADYYRLLGSNKEHKKHLNNVANTYKNIQVMATTAYNNGDKESGNRYVLMLNSITRGMSIEDYNYIVEKSKIDFKDSSLHNLLSQQMLNNYQGKKALVTNNNPQEGK